MKYFREKVTVIARGRESSNKYFEDLKDDELFVQPRVYYHKNMKKMMNLRNNTRNKKYSFSIMKTTMRLGGGSLMMERLTTGGDAKLPRVHMKKRLVTILNKV